MLRWPRAVDTCQPCVLCPVLWWNRGSCYQAGRISLLEAPSVAAQTRPSHAKPQLISRHQWPDVGRAWRGREFEETFRMLTVFAQHPLCSGCQLVGGRWRTPKSQAAHPGLSRTFWRRIIYPKLIRSYQDVLGQREAPRLLPYLAEFSRTDWTLLQVWSPFLKLALISKLPSRFLCPTSLVCSPALGRSLLRRSKLPLSLSMIAPLASDIIMTYRRLTKLILWAMALEQYS